MPDRPAKARNDQQSKELEVTPERLATPQELEEYGGQGPAPEMEAKILALLEAQLAEPSEEDLAAVGADAPVAAAEAVAAKEIATESASVAPEAQEKPAEENPSPEGQNPEIESSFEPPWASLRELPRRETHPLRTDLLEFAEALDQHRLWVESGGKEGVQGDFSGADLSDADLTAANLQGALLNKTNLRGAELSMANLRGASLVESDLRDTNLLGAEFSGASLMGANLYGAQGLWAGRLGGTNLFDATLPEAVSVHDGGKTIGQFTRAARWFYLLLMGLCAGSLALVALTKDVRLLLDKAALPIPGIPNVLPLQGFYLFAPLLLTILYFRLQFLVLRLWGSMGALPAVFPDGQTPEKDGSWYLMGPIRPHLRWSRDPRSPLAMVECVVAKLLAYWGVPATILFFWLRYLVMQDYRGTLLQVFLFTLTAAAACAVPRIVARVLRPGDWTDESTASFLHDVVSTVKVPAAVGFALLLLSLGVIRGLPADPSIRPEVGRGDPRRWAGTAFQSLGYRPYADITEASVAAPAIPEAAKENESSESAGPRLNEMTLRYARGYRAAFANARMWKANLEGASFSEADFRGVNLREGILRSAKMDRVQAAKASLVSADAQWANLSGADFRDGDLSYANLEGATLTKSNLSRATLYAVNLRHANLLRADMTKADVRDVKLEDAVLSLAVLEQTDLSAAKLTGANLTGAQAKGTIFLESDLSRSDLRGARFDGAILRQAKLDGARVEGADFRGALGLEAWQVCSTSGWRGAEFDLDVKAAVDTLCGGGASTPGAPSGTAIGPAAAH